MRLLLLIDAQEGFLEHDAMRSARDRIAELVDSDDYDRVWATRFVNPGPAGLFVRELGWGGMGAADPGTELWSDIAPHVDRVVEKHTYGLSSSLLRELSLYTPERVELAGYGTSSSVLAVAFQMFDDGLPVRIRADACGSAGGRAMHEAALRICRRQFGSDSVIGWPPEAEDG